MKKPQVILLIGVVCAVTAILVVSVMLAEDSFFSEEPGITYAEFPLELTYEINGEPVSVNEVYVAKYRGRNVSTGDVWDGYIQRTGEEGIVLFEDGDCKILCELGNVDFYTGKYTFENDSINPLVYLQEEKDGFLFFKETDYRLLTEEELYKEFGIRIISWTTSAPLKGYWERYQ